MRNIQTRSNLTGRRPVDGTHGIKPLIAFKMRKGGFKREPLVPLT
jgi:hypothetical protein